MATMSTTDIVNVWFTDRLATGAIARNTDAYNQALAALPDLISRLGTAAPATPAPDAKKATAAAKVAADAATLATDAAAAGLTAG